MAITLEQAKVAMTDKVEQTVYDQFRRESFLLDRLIFDNAVSPGTGGSTLTYGYQQLKSPSTASFRELNKDYTNNEALREKHSVDLKIFGGNFELDRVIIETAGQINELAFQVEQKVKGAVNLFHYNVINGDSSVDTKSFDGLKKLLTGSDTEITSKVDLSTITEEKAFEFIEEIDTFLSELDGRPSMLMGNSKLINKIKAVARRAGYHSLSEDAFGRSVDNYDGIPLVDLGQYYDGVSKKTVACVPVETDGTTALYAVNIALDGFHGVSPTGDKVIRTNMPDLNAPGVMKKGDIEAIMAVALKQTRKAGVLKGIKIGVVTP